MYLHIDSLGVGGRASLRVRALAMHPGVVFNPVTVAAADADAYLGNNSATAAVTVLDAPALSVNRDGNNLILSWQSGLGFRLQSARNLGPNGWVDVTATPVTAGNRTSVVVKTDQGTQFYRLRTP